ncbi:MAG: thioredoxin-like domain-containing protein [Pirellulales bacterium]
MIISLRTCCLLASLAWMFSIAPWAVAGPSVQDALSLQPVQKDAEIERPDAAEIAKCTIKAEGKRGWIVRDSAGQILRAYTDTNGDNVVDQWSYFRDGIEVYRDIDSNFNKKADQCRWLNTGGSRWGIDANEDGRIDFWKSISPEEVTAELVAAIRQRDRARFERLLLSDAELTSLGAGPEKAALLRKKIDFALANFAKLVAGQSVVTPGTRWVSFGGTQPGVVPAGAEDSTADLTVYENVMTMVETDGKAQPLTIGTMIQVKDNWRLIDLPNMSENASDPFFFAAPRPERPDGVLAGKPTERMQEIMKTLQALPDIAKSSPQQHDERTELLKQLAEESDTPENREQWYRQLADTLSAAVQTGGYEHGIETLKEIYESLKGKPKEEDLATYVEWRWMSAAHGHELATSDGHFGDIQEKWIGDLTRFVENTKKNPDSAEAMMELAIAQEFGGDEEQAIKWYDTIVREFPDAPIYAKAAGAKLRLTSVGKPIGLKGKTINGGQIFDLEGLKGKAVLIQYWATWCEPCKADMPLLKELRTKYKDFEVIGVCLDNDPQAMIAFLKENDPRWPQLFEEGGLDSRFANELGIQTLPTMILLDKQGHVVNRNIRADELQGELQRVLK